MNTARKSIRNFFTFVSIVTSTTFTTTGYQNLSLSTLFGGILLGALVSFAFMGLDTLIKNISFRTLLLLVGGLFVGALLGQGLWLLLSPLFQTLLPTTSFSILPLAQSLLLLLTSYLSVITLWQASQQFLLQLPFLELQKEERQRSQFIVDASLLGDPRLLDFAASGLLDRSLIIPEFVVHFLQHALEKGNEEQQQRAQRSLDTLHKLEALPHLELKKDPSDFQDIHEEGAKILRLAQSLNVNVLTLEIQHLERLDTGTTRIISLQSLSAALRPITRSGETLTIKVQRHGKEARQGVGYLEDGTMVVINGGGDFIGRTIKTQVLSVKQTSSGRMIFCNVADEESGLDESLSVDEEARQQEFVSL